MTEAAEEMLVKKAIEEASHEIGELYKNGQLKVLPEDYQVSLEDDHTGDPAVFVTVVLPKNTKSGLWTTPNLRPIIDSIQDEIGERDVDRLVYVSFSTKEALETPPDDEEVA